MKIALLSRFRPLIKELRGIHSELKRMNDMRQRELQFSGLYVGEAPPTGGDEREADEPTISYTDETRDYMRELLEAEGKVIRPEED